MLGLESLGELGTGSNLGPETCGSYDCSTTPVDATILSGGVAAVAAGREHTCVLTIGGGVKCWGLGGYGQLGDGTGANSTTPVDVTGLTSGVTAISAGDSHTCAISAGGGLKCWGENNSGKLGDGSSTSRFAPVDVTGLTSSVAGVSAAGGHTCAVTTSGGAKCWGYNQEGQLGSNVGSEQCGPFPAYACRRTPVDVTGLSSGALGIAAGGLTRSCARLSSGGVKCWGLNTGLVLGGSEPGPGPVDVVGLGGKACNVSPATDTDGDALPDCWECSPATWMATGRWTSIFLLWAPIQT